MEFFPPRIVGEFTSQRSSREKMKTLSVAWRALACSEFFNCKVQIHQSSMLYAL
jgi:hypothetical protein